ncbi:MAG: cation:proton antiporter [Candidatus Veblenbacteria bacterium]|nr:cation:proton antiporter [Candidatus Veblenbacteria bacterium]
MPLEQLFLDISLIVVVATAFGLVARLLKQPLILGYVVAGVVLGPSVLGLITQPEVISALSTFGIAFLLFLVGAELDLGKLKVMGKPSLLLGIGQVVFTAVIGFALARFFGLNSVPAAYVAIALTFSSTIIVVKLLSEHQALESLYGRLAIGMLLVQDFIAIFVLVLLSGFSGGQPPGTAELTFILLKGAGLIMLALLAGRWLLPPLFMRLARSSELLLLSSIAWCFAFSLIAALGGFSIEIGAFLAGLALARLPYHLEIVGRVRSLRDFFITIFFVMLGSQLAITALASLAPAFITLSLFVLVGNPLIVMLIMKHMGYTKRTGFLVGLTVAQISEFSLILMHLGKNLGHVGSAEVSLVTLVGVTTITLSSYLITYGETIYRKLAPYLTWFERKQVTERATQTSELSNHVVIFGCDRLGERLMHAVRTLSWPLLVIDFDPETVARLNAQGINCLYGDINDLDILERGQLTRARLVISTVPDLKDNQLLLQDLAQRGAQVPVYVTADTWQDTQALYTAGATYVIFPHYLSGERMSDLLKELTLNPHAITSRREQHLNDLKLHYAGRQKA